MSLLGGSMRRWGVRRAAPRAGKSCFRLAPRWLTRLCRLPGRTDSGRHSQAGASQDAREAAGQGGESGAARALAAQRAAQGAADALVRRDGRPAARRGQGTRPCVARPGAGADAARAGPELATVGTFALGDISPCIRSFDCELVSTPQQPDTISGSGYSLGPMALAIDRAAISAIFTPGCEDASLKSVHFWRQGVKSMSRLATKNN